MQRILIGIALVLALPVRAELVVIVSAKSPVTSLTREQVAQLFLGRATSFPGGGAVTPLDQKEGAAVRDEFYTKVVDKNAGQVKAYWAKQMFSGNGSPPRELGSSAEVKRAVAADPTAIGYVEKGVLDGTVKGVLSVP